MIDYVVYGKIIIDDIRLLSGEMVYEILGGGGAQAAFGARLWADSVGILTRSGTDIEQGPKEMLQNIGVDLQGWMQYEDIPTPHGLMAYDENEYMTDDDEINIAKRMKKLSEVLKQILSRDIPLPEDYKMPKVIHLVTEFVDEDMSKKALAMKEKGAIYSLEPLIDYRKWTNQQAMIDYFPNVDVVSPDWPSASGFAQSEDPKEVLQYWSKLGPACISIRNGIKGSYVWDRKTDQMWHIPIDKVEAIDPTGCGNAYAGGFAVGWHQFQNAKDAGAAGTISASYMAKSIGVFPVTLEVQAEAEQKREDLLKRIQPL